MFHDSALYQFTTDTDTADTIIPILVFV